jgi:autotransporter-associated beta strand protein
MRGGKRVGRGAMQGGNRVRDSGHWVAPSITNAYWLRLMAGTALAGGLAMSSISVSPAAAADGDGGKGAGPVGGGGVTYSNVINGGGSLIVTTDSGKSVTLSRANTYTGGTTVSANSTLNLSNSSALGTNGLSLLSGSTLGLTGGVNIANSVTVTGDPTFNITGANSMPGISGSGAVVVLGTSGSASTDVLTLTTTGGSTYTGPTTVGDSTTAHAVTLKGGATDAFSPNSATTVTANSILDLGGFAQTIGSLAGSGTVTNSGTVAATLTTGGNNSSTTFGGVIEDGTSATGLTKVGTGTFTLTGNNTYSGATNLNAGTIAVGSNTALGTSTLNMATGTTLQSAAAGLSLGNNIGLNGTNTIDTNGNVLTLSGVISGTGVTLDKIGGGTLTLAGNNAYSGTTSVMAGTLQAGSTTGLSANSAFVVGTGGTTATLDLNGNNSTIGSLAGNANGIVTNNGTGAATLTTGGDNTSTTFAGVIQDGTSAIGLTKVGTGTFTLTNLNTYSGLTTIANGTLALSGAGSIASSSGVNISASGVFDISGTAAGATIKTLSGIAGSSVTLGNQTLTLSNASGNFAGAITGTMGGLSIAGGTETLSGTSTYTGTTLISKGAGLTIASGGVLGTAASHTSLVTNGGTLTVSNGGSLTANTLNNSGTVDLGTNAVAAAGQLVTGNVSNAGVVNVFGTPTINGAFTNQSGGIVDLTQGTTPTANQLKTGAFNGQAGSAVDVRFDFSTVAGQASLLAASGTSGTTNVNYFNVTPGTEVVLGNAVTVIKDTTGSGSLTPTGASEAFGLINLSVQSDGHGGADLVRTLNVGATAAPAGSIMAALSAIDTSFHQSTAPFVASPSSQDPDKWTGGMWSRATAGQTTTSLTAFESLGGTSADLRVKTNFDAYEVGFDTGILNFGGSGWNGHFGIMAGDVMATSDELLSGSGTSVKFDIPFAGLYGVMTHGPFFMDLEYRHDWVNAQVTNLTANLVNTPLKGNGDSFSGAAGYHFDLVDNWFVEPTAGFGLSQTQFDMLATNLGQQAQGIAPGTITFDSIFSMLVHGGARVGTSFVVADTLALQPFGTLSVWRELGGQSGATFADSGVTDPLTLSRVGTFYQAGIGVSAQVLNTGFIGFARGDFRWGDNLNGAAFVGGLRYTFGP